MPTSLSVRHFRHCRLTVWLETDVFYLETESTTHLFSLYHKKDLKVKKAPIDRFLSYSTPVFQDLTYKICCNELTYTVPGRMPDNEQKLQMFNRDKREWD